MGLTRLEKNLYSIGILLLGSLVITDLAPTGSIQSIIRNVRLSVCVSATSPPPVTPYWSGMETSNQREFFLNS